MRWPESAWRTGNRAMKLGKTTMKPARNSLGTACAAALIALAAWTGPAAAGPSVQMAASARCETCGDALIRAVDICLSSSAMPETCVQQAMNNYYNCAKDEPDACEGTKGRQLYDCINTCETLACVEICLRGVR